MASVTQLMKQIQDRAAVFDTVDTSPLLVSNSAMILSLNRKRWSVVRTSVYGFGAVPGEAFTVLLDRTPQQKNVAQM